MKFNTSIVAVLSALAASVAAGHASEASTEASRHTRLARKVDIALPAREPLLRKRKTCKPRPPVTAVSTQPAPQPVPSQPPPSQLYSGGASSGSVLGLVRVISSGSCGSSGATAGVTALSGPNGHIDFLNCGLTEGGWTPPLIHVEDIVTSELSDVVYKDGSAFSNCKAYIPIFEKYGQQYGVPAIMLASFAMQESSCVSSTVGGAGEQGLMQLTPDKCDGAPNGDCKDPDFNIHQGAKFFSETLDSVNGDLLLAIGKYNGWHQGLTYVEATAASLTGNCREQNNLDYLHQFLNGWLQDINAYEHNPPLGKYFNLNVCDN
ncbi:glycoside hydrolase family 23 protein [Phlebopus sp. FC_14]|nr:glycoside hydrolase family 23 protein [Phlebopus sp. FC_14]